jgi:hypothetical protein
MKSVKSALLLAVIAVSTAGAADAPYFGKWKLNPSKSQLANTTVTFERTPSGDYRFDAGGFVYYFRLDGKEYPMPDGGTTSWRELSADTWECTNRRNGKISATYKGTVKGDTLTFLMTIPQTGGKDITQSSTSTRISGGPGFPGKWQTTEANIAATGLELTANGNNGLVIKYPEFSSECAGQFDGKPYPKTGSGDGAKSTMAFRKTGPASFEFTTFLDGKPYDFDAFTVSQDGSVLTDNETPASKKEPNTAVYERQ